MNERLRLLRITLELSQEEFGSKIGIKSRAHISSMEKGRREIIERTIKDICRVYSISEQWFRTGEGEMFAKQEDLSSKFESLIDDFSLSELKKINSFIDTLIEIKERHPDPELYLLKATSEPEFTKVMTFTQSVSAGTGQYLDDDSAQELFYPAEKVPDDTDFAVPVSGDSMEPMFYDGDIIFIQRSPTLNLGDIGLFTVDGDVFVKECGEHGLISKNKKYPIIEESEFKDFRTIGKVLGKL